MIGHAVYYLLPFHSPQSRFRQCNNQCGHPRPGLRSDNPWMLYFNYDHLSS
jgi:hypothetical protein